MRLKVHDRVLGVRVLLILGLQCLRQKQNETVRIDL